MLHTQAPYEWLSDNQNSVLEGGPFAGVIDYGDKRVALCTCDCFRYESPCRHIWIVALVQAGLNRLKLRPMPTFRLDFGRAHQQPSVDNVAAPVEGERL
jgi:hypothetical protein